MSVAATGATPRRARRQRWRAYLLLSRISNAPTVWSNVLAGLVLSSIAWEWSLFVRLAAAVSLFYTGGMFLNDAFDAPFDARVRPERPIPAGDVSRREVFLAGAGLLAAGELLLAPRADVLAWGAALAAAIVLYDWHHKGRGIAPVIMGSCRALVYCVAAASSGGIGEAVVIGALAMAAYVAGLTIVARLAGANARWLVPLLIAGISLVDAAFIAVVSGSASLAAAAALGFPLTLFLQRFVPGD